MSVSDVKCSDSEDGTAQITFERKLDADEELEISFKEEKGLFSDTKEATSILSNNTSYTLDNLPPGKYTVNLIGKYRGENTYTGNPTRHKASFEIKKPDPVKINAVSKTDVFCHGGEDGKIDLSITGGTGTYQYTMDSGETWNNFSSKNPFSIKNLKKGTYRIKVRDSNACMAKNEQGGEKTIEQEITEPEFPVSLSNIVLVEPTGYGLKNGYISLRVKGGTPYDNGSYSFEWKKQGESKSISKNITTDALGEPFTIKVDSLSKGTYVLTVKDKNHAGSSSMSDQCGIISRTFTLEEPDLLTVSIAQEKAISCHLDNEYDFKIDLNGNGIPDEAEDGILRTSSSGGVGTYAYQWQKSQNGELINIPSANASSLEKVTAGRYRVIVTDTNGNTATSDMLVSFPSKMNIYFDASGISCNDQNSGMITARVEGGAGGYSYLWNTSDKEAVVRDLSAGSYFLNVKDSKGCMASKSMEIDQPGGLEVEDLFVNDPSCFGAENGAIGVRISGGKAPYTLEWSNGMKTPEIRGLKKGVYTLSFTDANGCSSFKEYTLKDPEKLKINLAENITLCSGDSQEIDIKIEDPHASYVWKDASGNMLSQKSSMVLSSAGTYLAEIMSARGCSSSAQITVERSSAILNPEFLMPSHAYKEKSVKLVNISSKRPEKSEWIIPEDQDIRVVSSSEESLELLFSKEGAYKIGMKGTEGKCQKTLYKNILVEENLYGPEPDPFGPSNILEFEISSPQNQAEKHLSIRLEKEAPIKLKMVNLIFPAASHELVREKNSSFEISLEKASLPGLYLIILETKGEVMVKKMSVN